MKVNILECENCRVVLSSLRSYIDHKSKFHRREPSMKSVTTTKECDYCDYSAPKKTTLERHISSVHLNEKVECPECHKNFSKHKLKEHLKLVHGPKTEYCDVCSKYVSHLKEHKRKSHAEKKCQFCDKSFYGQSSYFQHIKKVHKEDNKEKFRCSSCDYTTRAKENLQKHDQVNHNINYIYCDQCEYKTKLKCRFNEHQKKKHDGNFQKFQCDQCDYQCVRSDYLKKHIQSKHEKIRYPCDQCGYQATRRQYLNKHLETIHKS